MKTRALILWLYPASWRVRYGDEFLALLEELDLSLPLVADVALAAMKIRLTALAHPLPQPRFAGGAATGGNELLVRSFAGLALAASVLAAVLFVLHSFAYLMVAVLAGVFVLAAGVASLLERRGPRPSG